MAIFTARITAGQDDCYSTSGETFDNDNIQVILGYNGTYVFNGGFRFLNVTIPQGATINSAKITMRARLDKTGTCAVNIYGNDVDDAPAFADSSQNRPSDIVVTTATVAYSIPSWSANTDYDTPDLKSIVQEIVDRAGWSSGNDMRFAFKNGTSSETRLIISYETSTETCALLTVDYTASAGNTTNFFQFI